MDLTHRFSVPAPVEEAWRAFNHLEALEPCLPGATITSVNGNPGPLGAGGYATNGRLHDAVLAQLAVERADDVGAEDEDRRDEDQGATLPVSR